MVASMVKGHVSSLLRRCHVHRWRCAVHAVLPESDGAPLQDGSERAGLRVRRLPLASNWLDRGEHDSAPHGGFLSTRRKQTPCVSRDRRALVLGPCVAHGARARACVCTYSDHETCHSRVHAHSVSMGKLISVCVWFSFRATKDCDDSFAQDVNSTQKIWKILKQHGCVRQHHVHGRPSFTPDVLTLASSGDPSCTHAQQLCTVVILRSRLAVRPMRGIRVHAGLCSKKPRVQSMPTAAGLKPQTWLWFVSLWVLPAHRKRGRRYFTGLAAPFANQIMGTRCVRVLTRVITVATFVFTSAHDHDHSTS